MAMVWTEGNRRRTTESSSKPDMRGMLRSERTMSGISVRISANAEKPSSAVRTQYPISVSKHDNDVRIEDSSSTMSSFNFVSGISNPTVTFIKGIGVSMGFVLGVG